MRYTILYATYSHGLEKEVNEYIYRGWEPVGAPFLSGSGWYQAMILKQIKSS